MDSINFKSLTDNLNRLTLHFCLFSLEFKLINDPNQYDPIRTLLDQLLPPEKVKEIKNRKSKLSQRKKRRMAGLTTKIDSSDDE